MRFRSGKWLSIMTTASPTYCGCGIFRGCAMVQAAEIATLMVTLGDIEPGGVVPDKFAFCLPADSASVTLAWQPSWGKLRLGPNISPAIHWSEYAESNAAVFPGKPVGRSDYGVRGVHQFGPLGRGVRGGGYDGPCPPVNDPIPHRYRFTVYALDVPSLGLSGDFSGPDALEAMQGHILARGEVTGLYTLNLGVAKSLSAQ